MGAHTCNRWCKGVGGLGTGVRPVDTYREGVSEQEQLAATSSVAAVLVGLPLPDALARLAEQGLEARVVDWDRLAPGQLAWLTQDLEPRRVTLRVRSGAVTEAKAG